MGEASNRFTRSRYAFVCMYVCMYNIISVPINIIINASIDCAIGKLVQPISQSFFGK